MNIIQAFTKGRKERKKKKYEKNKLKKIAVYSKRYDTKKHEDYQLSTAEKEGAYLESLKQTLLNERLTMLGAHKLDTLRYCTEQCLQHNIEGDLIETGVWKGGATIYLAGILRAYGARNRKVYVADSFEGLPPPDPEKYPLDKGDTHYTREDLAVSVEEVKANFQRFDLLADNVVFVKGFFEESLKAAGIDRLSVLRLDGDMYGSTRTVLEQLYHKLEVGGYLILDDWLLKGAREALLDFRKIAGIEEDIYQDYSGVFWKKTKPTQPLNLSV